MAIMDPPSAETVAAPAFTEEDRARLAELEQTISTGLEEFLRVGRALNEIRERRLYRVEFDSFEEYLPVLHQHGPDVAVDAFKGVSEKGTLPSATKVRQKLAAAGLVNRPQRDVADLVQLRLSYIEDALPKITPTPS